MESKNTIIQNYAGSLLNAASAITSTSGSLNENESENNATIKIMYVLIESLRAQTILLQNALDDYNK